MSADEYKLVEKHVAELAEHFDTVQIFCSKHRGAEDVTTDISAGAGNLFARIGQVQCWKAERDQMIRESVIDRGVKPK